jgi:putative membrane protein
MKRTRFLLALPAVMVCLAFTVQSRSEDKNKDQELLTDEQFVQKASAIDLAEINLGNLAAKLGHSSQVKEFAEHMIKDHGKSSKNLLAICNTKGFKAATAMDRKHQELEEKLKTLTGADFDKDYMKHMVTGHEKAVALYQQQIKQGKDKDLKNFAETTLPVVQMHLKMAKDWADKNGKTERKP